MHAPLANGGGPLLLDQTVNRISWVCAATQLDAVLMQPMRFAMTDAIGRAVRGGSSDGSGS